MARIVAPVEGYRGIGAGGVVFENGEGQTDDPRLIAYFRKAGYGIDGDPPARPAEPEPADPRDVTRTVSSPLRDAAVDPREGDFQAPTNAGDGDPHGPDVVAPGLPGAPVQPTAPPAAAPAATGDSPGRPTQAAQVADWRAYAATQAKDSDEAAAIEKMTKAELITKYGS